MPKTHTPAFRRKVVRDYERGEASICQVAQKHRISPSTLHRWIENESGASATSAVPDDYRLTGGQWVNDRGVMRWESHRPKLKRFPSARDRRATEEAMFTQAEAREAHAGYVAGVRESRTVIGERVYQRRQKRNKRSQEKAA